MDGTAVSVVQTRSSVPMIRESQYSYMALHLFQFLASLSKDAAEHKATHSGATASASITASVGVAVLLAVGFLMSA